MPICSIIRVHQGTHLSASPVALLGPLLLGSETWSESRRHPSYLAFILIYDKFSSHIKPHYFLCHSFSFLQVDS